MKNGTLLQLNGQLGPAVEVQSTSAETAELKDRSTWQLAAHGVPWFFTFYKCAEVH